MWASRTCCRSGSGRSRPMRRSNKMPNYIDAYQIHDQGLETSWKRAMNMMRKEKVYFSLDIDGIDPAYAPGTGTPEPFGLSSYDVKKCINMLGERMVGFDVNEISPPYDHGNTAALGARMIQEVICVVWKHSRQEVGHIVLRSLENEEKVYSSISFSAFSHRSPHFLAASTLLASEYIRNIGSVPEGRIKVQPSSK